MPYELARKFTVSAPNKVWVSDISYVRQGRAGCILRSARPLLTQGHRLGYGYYFAPATCR